jgi:hypothetical protein
MGAGQIPGQIPGQTMRKSGPSKWRARRQESTQHLQSMNVRRLPRFSPEGAVPAWPEWLKVARDPTFLRGPEDDRPCWWWPSAKDISRIEVTSWNLKQAHLVVESKEL